jgi:hypothetical protein
LVAYILVLEVADVIRSRIGEPTVDALARRFGPGGTCLTCGGRFAAGRLSVRAYHGDDEIITLIAYHADCAASAWLQVGQAAMPDQGTWAAASTNAVLPVTVTGVRRPRRAAARAQALPVMLVHPSLDLAHVRYVAVGEAVTADREDCCRQGSTDPGPFSRRCRLSRVGQTWMLRNRDHLLACVVAGDRAWSAPVRQRPLADLIISRRGMVAGITCDEDPAELTADASMLNAAIVSGEVLLGWAPLGGQQ